MFMSPSSYLSCSLVKIHFVSCLENKQVAGHDLAIHAPGPRVAVGGVTGSGDVRKWHFMCIIVYFMMYGKREIKAKSASQIY